MWHFSAAQLRTALETAGFLENTRTWKKPRLITTCRQMRIKGSDLQRDVGIPTEQAPAEAARPQPAQASAGRGRQRRRSSGRNDQEWRWFKEDFVDQASYEDEQWQERRQAGGERRRPRGRRGPRDFDEVLFYEAEAKAVAEGLPGSWEEGGWDEDDEAWYDEFCAAGPGSPPRQRPRWSVSTAPRSEARRPTEPSAPVEAPEEVMARAVREGWPAERLSRAQAALLLGTAVAPTQDEVREAKRRVVLRWHPDRNQDDPAMASSALRLALAASGVLR